MNEPNRSYRDRSRLLRNALRANAAFSLTCGFAMLAFADPIARLIGLETATVVLIVGASLLPFGAGLLRNAARERIDRKEAALGVALDSIWVVGAFAVVAAGVLSTTGVWLLAAVTEVVLAFAVIQALGLGRVSDA